MQNENNKEYKDYEIQLSKDVTLQMKLHPEAINLLKKIKQENPRISGEELIEKFGQMA